jgi:hypothetical protein
MSDLNSAFQRAFTLLVVLGVRVAGTPDPARLELDPGGVKHLDTSVAVLSNWQGTLGLNFHDGPSCLRRESR